MHFIPEKLLNSYMYLGQFTYFCNTARLLSLTRPCAISYAIILIILYLTILALRLTIFTFYCIYVCYCIYVTSYYICIIA